MPKGFVLLIICVVGIANGPVGLVVFYEQEVKDRVVELGLTTNTPLKLNQQFCGHLFHSGCVKVP